MTRPAPIQTLEARVLFSTTGNATFDADLAAIRNAATGSAKSFFVVVSQFVSDAGGVAVAGKKVKPAAASLTVDIGKLSTDLQKNGPSLKAEAVAIGNTLKTGVVTLATDTTKAIADLNHQNSAAVAADLAQCRKDAIALTADAPAALFGFLTAVTPLENDLAAVTALRSKNVGLATAEHKVAVDLTHNVKSLQAVTTTLATALSKIQRDFLAILRVG